MISKIRIQGDSKLPSLPAWLAFVAIGILFITYGLFVFTLIDLQPAHWDFLTFGK